MIENVRDIIEIVGIIAVPLGTWAVIQWRVGQLEAQRQADLAEHQRQARAVEDQRQADLAFAKEERARIQNEWKVAVDEAWRAIHKLEGDFHKHEIDALQERLIIERRFGENALMLANFGGDVKTVKEVVLRLETTVNGLKEEKRS